ncbi:MAG: hypothetical protein WCO09_04380, partial [bacterium]
VSGCVASETPSFLFSLFRSLIHEGAFCYLNPETIRLGGHDDETHSNSQNEGEFISASFLLYHHKQKYFSDLT